MSTSPHRCSTALRAAVVVSVSVLAALAAPAPASANLAAASRAPAALGGPAPLAPTRLVVEGETLTFDCDPDPVAGVACAFEAVYRIHNPTDAAESTVAAFYSVRARDIKITLDDASCAADLTDAQLRQLDALIPATRDDGYLLRAGLQNVYSSAKRDGLAFDVAPDQRRVIRVTGTLTPGTQHHPSYALSPVQTRHPVLGDASAVERFDLDYLIGPIRTWARVGAIDVTITWPAGWSMRGKLHHVDPTVALIEARERGDTPEAIEALRRTLESKPRPRSKRLVEPSDKARASGHAWRKRVASSAQRNLAAVTLDAARPADTLSITLTEPERVLLHGGPFATVGGALGAQGGFRVGLGYDIAAPDFMLYSLYAETDASERLLIAPSITWATPSALILPSLGFGVGVPVLVAPETAVGARALAEVHFPLLGFVTALDWFPAASDLPETPTWQWTLLGRISL